jgi:hypothetical protein
MLLFERPLAASDYSQLTEKLNFDFRSYMAQMKIQNGVVVDVRRLETDGKPTVGLNPPVSTQLLLGYRSCEELRTCPLTSPSVLDTRNWSMFYFLNCLLSHMQHIDLPSLQLQLPG